MRTIEVRILKTAIIIVDWNHAHWQLFNEKDGTLRCRLPGCTAPERFRTFYDFLTTMYGQRQIGKFINYEVKITDYGQ